MQLAYVMTEERGATDRLMSELAEKLQAKGIRLAGIVQTNVECYDKELCDMDVRVLPEGETIRISQSLGAGARGCRLNPEALEQAVGQVSASLQAGEAPQLMIVNKFGKHEADGRGMRAVIGEALALGIPVISGVNKMNVEPFQAFADGMAVAAGPDLDGLVAWAEQAVAATA
ncbi:3-dehydroquinate dehydratase [Rhodobacteraceae bacterium (ex Bugula neritina AB1)]|nr:3-dehydroquinate dehydratase [Rhodobacteraceae bacterium (ex Bugula neritina AB1)]